MTKILAISGKKQSGKTTATNFLIGMEMLSLNLITHFRMTDDGKLEVPAQLNDGVIEDRIFDPLNVTPQTYEYLAVNVWPTIKQYNFADPLKRGVCMGILGLTYEQCYGTDAQKDEPTNIKWEDMPRIVGHRKEDMINEVEKHLKAKAIEEGIVVKKLTEVLDTTVYHESGFMSGREIMQYVGTEIFRKIYGNVWIDCLIRQINAEGTRLALVGDCRFPNEVEGIQKAGGIVIRFTRNQESKDRHASETALDPDKFDWSKFDVVIDNSNMDINAQNEALYKVLEKRDMLPYTLKHEEGKYIAT